MPECIPPPPAPPLQPLSHAERVRQFGRFRWEPNPSLIHPGRIIVDAGWISRNVIVVELPQLSHCNQGSPPRVRVHRLAAVPLLTLANAWRNAGLSLHVVSWDGCLVERFKRGHAGGDEADLSAHAWGVAFDVNARWNRPGCRPAPLGKPGCVLPLLELAREHGWAWGGDSTPPEGAHFECVRV